MDELLDEGQPQARGLLADVDIEGTTVQLPTAGFKVNGEVPGPRRAPARLGADNESVLSKLGYDATTIERFTADGII